MKKDINIILPEPVSLILCKLEQNGFEAFAVGGCIRDSIIGNTPQDWDIATSAKPDQVKAIFSKTIDTGLQHGTVTVMLDDIAYEITTFRIEGKYINNRKPEQVEFTDSIIKDLSRRDFTVNALAYNPSKGLLDPFGGLLDISNKQIKAVGTAEERFQEDALRMMRAIRFSAQLGYEIEQDTLDAIKQQHALIRNISGERIRVELSKTLLANPMSFILLHNTKILSVIMPELDICFALDQNNPYHIYNVGMHSLHAAQYIRPEFMLRWTMLLHDIGKATVRTTDSQGIDHFYAHQVISAEKARTVMERLHFDNTSMTKITKLIREHDREIAENQKSVRKAVAAIGVDLFDDWLQVRRADTKAQNPASAAKRMEQIDQIEVAYKKIISENQCLTLKALKIGGNDLITLGMPQSIRIGEVLRQLLEEVLETPELNDKATLLKLAKKYI